MKLRSLRIDVEAESGPLGVDISFSDGLNVIRADNSSGKSTCFQSIVYALGLDAMLSARQHQLPLPAALTTKIFDSRIERESKVLSAKIWLEVEGSEGRIATIYRPIVGLGDHRLITVFDMALESARTKQAGTQYYLRIRGSASAQHGFHRWLAQELLGWSLPRVAMNDGSEGRLYLETIFPLFFVEQRFGWSRIQGNMPYVFGIKDVAKRATEFVLGLSANDIELERNALKRKLAELHTRYTSILDSARNAAKASGIALQGLPEKATFEPLSPQFMVFRGGEWLRIDTRIEKAKVEIFEREAALRKITVNESTLSVELGERRSTILIRLSESKERLWASVREQASLIQRAHRLADDSRRLEDLRALARVGGAGTSDANLFNCPTCWQPVADSISPDLTSVMSLQDTLGFVRAELALVNAALKEAATTIDRTKTEVQELEHALSRLDGQIRVTRKNESRADDIDNIKQLLALEQDLETLQESKGVLDAIFESLLEIVAEVQTMEESIKQLPTTISDSDDETLISLETDFQSQEREYGFKSFSIPDLKISRENYRPSMDGFELSFETSASDAIRTIWSYLLAIMETCRGSKTANHARLLMFDEPRQQGANRLGFGQLLRHAALSKPFGEQVVFFTSDDADLIYSETDGSDVTITEFSGWLLSPTKS